ncbi:hypothetical protein GMST_19050 [Geomonas silvestris]|uniref:FMN-binding domain-containing protein n=1 Tax=Geomonas silvestris TaxID=2740184 RepID=A0A6V8MHV3_9BACT|nr:hypothetical protein [Geomonas silvestris]GFO59580.1 hypothetical protein GMST_19050 [Geomonas silvestris]
MLSGKITFYATLFMLIAHLVLGSGQARGAVGCDLNDPDRDVARLFPGSTGYKTVYIDLRKLGGDRLVAQVESRLRDRLHGLYETVDVPYTVYVIYQGKKKIGYIHGVNQKGRYGGIAVFLALDLNERIKSFYIQKISGPEAGKFRTGEFGRQFAGLSLKDFELYDVVSGKGGGKVSGIANPVGESDPDFRLTLRGTKKNLLFVNEFLKLASQWPPPKGKTAP